MDNNIEKQAAKDLSLQKQKNTSSDNDRSSNNAEYKRRPRRSNYNKHKPRNKPVKENTDENTENASDTKSEKKRDDKTQSSPPKENGSKPLSRLWIVIPCYNEENVLPITSQLFLDELYDLIKKRKISKSSRILFVNDGSKDSTWDIIKDLARSQYFVNDRFIFKVIVIQSILSR